MLAFIKAHDACIFSFKGDQSGDRAPPPREPLPLQTASRSQPSHRGKTGAFQIWQQVILLELVRQRPKVSHPPKDTGSVQKHLDYVRPAMHRQRFRRFSISCDADARNGPAGFGTFFHVVLDRACVLTVSCIVKQFEGRKMDDCVSKVHEYTFPDHFCKCNV